MSVVSAPGTSHCGSPELDGASVTYLISTVGSARHRSQEQYLSVGAVELRWPWTPICGLTATESAIQLTN